jgi:hypothetical protein
MIGDYPEDMLEPGEAVKWVQVAIEREQARQPHAFDLMARLGNSDELRDLHRRLERAQARLPKAKPTKQSAFYRKATK